MRVSVASQQSLSMCFSLFAEVRCVSAIAHFYSINCVGISLLHLERTEAQRDATHLSKREADTCTAAIGKRKMLFVLQKSE
jgi:hypothetical protein